MSNNKYMLPSPKRAKKHYLSICVAALALTICTIIVLKGPFRNISYPVDTEVNSDYNRLIDITFNFKQIPMICNNIESLYVVAVHTSPSNFDKRETIRETWGRPKKNNPSKVLFFLGTVDDAELKIKLDEEIYEHQDVVQGDFLDSYRNLTYKHMVVLKYFLYHCSNVEYLLKVDDDTFVNTPNLRDFIDLYNYRYKRSKNILCEVLYSAPVLRDGKWEISREEYKEDAYPDYCLGYAIIYPRQVVASLYQKAQKSEYFWIDDVFISGIIAKQAGVKHKSISPLVLGYDEVINIVNLSFTNITKPFLFGRLNLDTHQIRSLWEFVEKYAPKTNILDYIS